MTGETPMYDALKRRARRLAVQRKAQHVKAAMRQLERARTQIKYTLPTTDNHGSARPALEAALEAIAMAEDEMLDAICGPTTPFGSAPSSDELEQAVLSHDASLGIDPDRQLQAEFRSRFGRYFPELAKKTREEIR